MRTAHLRGDPQPARPGGGSPIAVPAYPIGAAVAAVVVVCLELLWLRTGVFRQPAYWLSMLVLFAFMIPVDGWMSKVPNPIVVYDPDVLSGVRFPIDIPLEEFVYAFAMLTLAIVLWERAGRGSHPAAAGRRT